MLSPVLQSQPCRGPSLEELAHTPAMPWLIRAVRASADFQDLLESDVALEHLELYGDDTWRVLSQSPVFDEEDILRCQLDLSYDEEHVAFYPVALLAHQQAPALRVQTSYSAAELAKHNEKALMDLVQGRTVVSAAAKRALGTGYTDLLTPEQGVSLLSWMEVGLTDGSTLLGWGWLWHRKAR